VGESIGTFFVVLVAFVGGMFFWMPRLVRRELFFAVTVRAEFPESDEGQAILRRYGLRVVLVTLVSAAVVVWGAATARLATAMAASLVEIGGCFWAFLRARAAALPHAGEPTAVREARLAPRQIRVPGGWPAQIAPLAILAGAAIFLWTEWQRIPARFPVHWALDGQPNRWSERSLGGVFGPLLLGGVFIALLIFSAFAIVRWTRRVHATGSAAEAEVARERRFLLLLVFTEYILAGIVTWAALLPLRSMPTRSPSPAPLMGLLTILLLVLLFLFVVYLPRQPAPAGGARPVGDRTGDRYWKGGVLYFNPKDPALLVEKRFGIGYTVNFGHWLTWLFLAVLVLIPLLAHLFLRSH
jgi:uncharacterized membrane protein